MGTRFMLGGGLVATVLLLMTGCTAECPEGGNPDSLYCHASATDNADAVCESGTSLCDDSCVDLGSDPDNCGACGSQCDDELVCNGGVCSDMCGGGLSRCGNQCVDFDMNVDNCGGCGITCDAGEVCSQGSCQGDCQAPLIECGGQCIDPATDEAFCGATNVCTGADAGQSCGPNDACEGGVCVSQLTYVGSLPSTKGRWTYTGVVGIAGANAACEQFVAPGSRVCSHAQMLAANAKGELAGATAITSLALNAPTEPVTEWWIEQTPEDINVNPANPAVRCVDNTAENIPWSYPTGHLKRAGYYASVAAVGTLQTNTQDNATGFCRAFRHVPCCLPQ